MTKLTFLALSLLALFSAPIGLEAQTLRVSPVTLEVTAPGAATTLTLSNEGRQPVTVQTRVFHWDQAGGTEQYLPTQDVVVSPPMTQLAPGARQTVRVIRTTRAPVRAEEAYRIYVDEVPDRARIQAGTVTFATRLRIPVFFVQPGAAVPNVSWSLRRVGDAMELEARNVGDVRLRVADLNLSRGGATVARQDGLLGYVLGGSVMRWSIGSASRIGSGKLNLQVSTNRGALRADVIPR